MCGDVAKHGLVHTKPLTNSALGREGEGRSEGNVAKERMNLSANSGSHMWPDLSAGF